MLKKTHGCHDLFFFKKTEIVSMLKLLFYSIVKHIFFNIVNIFKLVCFE
jgi:hypothetical protein